MGPLIALGAMIGGMLAAPGGADRVVNSFVDNVSSHRRPWVMAGVAALIGIPLFFEVGVVLLVPIVLLVARRSSRSVLSVGIPALAGLSVLHGLVPPPGAAGRHQRPERRPRPDPLFGLIAAVPCVVLAGPVFGQWISRRLDLPARRSLFFSHVNDAGFWLVKEYFGMTVGHTITSWSVMETIISVVGLLAVLALSVVV